MLTELTLPNTELTLPKANSSWGRPFTLKMSQSQPYSGWACAYKILKVCAPNLDSGNGSIGSPLILYNIEPLPRSSAGRLSKAKQGRSVQDPAGNDFEKANMVKAVQTHWHMTCRLPTLGSPAVYAALHVCQRDVLEAEDLHSVVVGDNDTIHAPDPGLETVLHESISLVIFKDWAVNPNGGTKAAKEKPRANGNDKGKELGTGDWVEANMPSANMPFQQSQPSIASFHRFPVRSSFLDPACA